jgi:hypothetical protein
MEGAVACEANTKPWCAIQSGRNIASENCNALRSDERRSHPRTTLKRWQKTRRQHDSSTALSDEVRAPKVFIFLCNNQIYLTCIEKSVFGSDKSWPLQIAKGDYCILHHYDAGALFGLWKAEVNGGRNLESCPQNKEWKIPASGQGGPVFPNRQTGLDNRGT